MNYAKLKEELGFGFVYGLLVVMLAVSAFVFGALGPWQPTKIVKLPSPPAKISTGAEASRALGNPDSEVDGAQINKNWAGLTCDIWQSKQTVVCFRK